MKPFETKPAFLISAAVLIFLILASIFLNIFPQRLTGSFEYVRKGEELFDKGKYPQAIAYFEKASQSSPDNEKIRSGLVWAYSIYSKKLAKGNKHDEAINYLNKAYSLTPNSSASQNLALAYSEKAIYEARRGDISAANGNYAKARNYALITDSVRKNLAIALYNDGIGEFRSGREDLAILCLKQSSFIYQDPKTFEMLGDIYYRRSELKMARYYWHKALSLNPGNSDLSQKLKRLTKEMALASGGLGTSTPHFEIRYSKSLIIDRPLASETLEKAYDDIGKDLGYFPEKKTKVFFYSKEEFGDTFNMPYFVKAFYDGSIKMPAPSAELDKTRFSSYIYHEYTHAIVSAKTNNNCPVWFSEGIAVWEEFKKEGNEIEKIVGNIRTRPEISFKFLNESFVSEEIDYRKAVSYIVAYTLVDFIVDEWGMRGLRGLLKRLADKQHIVNAIDDEFLISESEFENRWRDYAAGKFFKNNS